MKTLRINSPDIRPRRLTGIAIPIAAALALAGCSQGTNSEPSPISSPSVTESATPCPTVVTAPRAETETLNGSIELKSAAEITAHLKDKYCDVSGLLSPFELSPINTELGAHRLYPDAAISLNELANEFKSEFGGSLQITDSYRNYEAQVDLYVRKPDLAAVPGESDHGWGLAIDVASNVDQEGSLEHEWMEDYADNFGWKQVNPPVQGKFVNQPWHFEFQGDIPLPLTTSYTLTLPEDY